MDNKFDLLSAIASKRPEIESKDFEIERKEKLDKFLILLEKLKKKVEELKNK